MNLHGIVSGVISAVNPNVPVEVRTSTGSATAADGSRTPTYADPVVVTGQVQELTTKDLRQLDGLNVQGSQRAVYLSGEVDAIQRISRLGGDLVALGDGSVWLTTHVLEQWPDWCKVAVTLQNEQDT